MNAKYQIGGHVFDVLGEALCQAVNRISGFQVFKAADEAHPLFAFEEDTQVPQILKVLYPFESDGTVGQFGRTEEGFILQLNPEEGEPLYMWGRDGKTTLKLNGNFAPRYLKFALWVGYGLMTLPYDTVAVHTSCIVYNDKAVLFLGESGTGKSIHTRLWRENIEGAFLLNDDSPIIRIEDGKAWAYGSPWSGKTPYYKQERYELAGCVRLSQAPANQMRKLSVLHAYGAIHPSCPPEFAYDSSLYEHVSRFISSLISSTSFYHLACLPNKEAAELSCSAVMKDI